MLRRTQVRQSSADFIEKWNAKLFWKTSAAMAVGSAGLLAVGYPVAGGVLGVTTAAFTARGITDLRQTNHTVKRNFPVLAHVRYLLESIRPEIYQYFIESEHDENPYSRDRRAAIYQRAKGVTDTIPFGTRRNVYDDNYEWVTHSMYPKERMPIEKARVLIGEGQCKKPYSSSLLNVSAMSFGAISPAAIRALNGGAKIGNFSSNTGEGSVSPYHLENGGDLVFNMGTGYFGVRTKDGKFDLEKFKDVTAHESLKMIELKLSQGAKPGKGGVLPGEKVTPIIAKVRGLEVGKTCYSPARHSAFTTPESMCEFAQTLREASGGKPVGIKMCMGDPVEICKLIRACRETKLYFDFITLDGGEGGTGASPVEFTNHVGTPLNEGLYFIHNVLRGAGIREHTKVTASGKIATGFSLFRALHLGADNCNAARAFMFSLGCIQSLKCNTNTCPTGIATQDEYLQSGLHVPTKTQRVASFQKKTVEAALDMVAAAGLSDLSEMRSRPMLMMRTSEKSAAFSYELFPKLAHEELLEIDELHKAGNHERMHASLQGLSHKDRLIRAWIISGDDSLTPKIKCYMR